MEVTRVLTRGLGDSTYVVIHEGTALIIDPQRDFDRFTAVTDDAGAELRFVLETHVHNDYVSGARRLATERGAELVMPAAAAPDYPCLPAFHLEEIPADGLVIRPIHTPGHTPEHTSYLIRDDGPIWALFSGGSLLVGSIGRPDLLGMDRADTLARLQYASVNRLAALPDDVVLYPTHGAGSFCTSARAGAGTSTIGKEMATNPFLAHHDVAESVAAQLGNLSPYPAYYQRTGRINLAQDVDGTFHLPPEMKPVDLTSLPADVTIIDARPAQDFAAGHLPGSLSIELRPDFGTWAGWIVEFGPVALVLDSPADLEEATRQLWRVGHDEIVGWLHGLAGWEGGLSTYRSVGVPEFVEAVTGQEVILDVRSPREQARGVIEGSTLRYLPDVFAEVDDLFPAGTEVWIACASGQRASIAASHLEKQGYRPVVLTSAGVGDVLAALNRP